MCEVDTLKLHLSRNQKWFAFTAWTDEVGLIESIRFGHDHSQMHPTIRANPWQTQPRVYGNWLDSDSPSRRRRPPPINSNDLNRDKNVKFQRNFTETEPSDDLNPDKNVKFHWNFTDTVPLISSSNHYSIHANTHTNHRTTNITSQYPSSYIHVHTHLHIHTTQWPG